MWSREMSHFAPVLARLLQGDPGLRAYVRQTGHSLSPGMQVADAAGRRGERREVRGWESGRDGVLPLVAGSPGEGGLRAKLTQRVEEILVERLKAREWAGWAAREQLVRLPDVQENWRVQPWEVKQAERLAIRRLLDGAARAHFRGEQSVPPCPGCRHGKDEQEHYLLVCPALGKLRDKWWGEVMQEVGT